MKKNVLLIVQNNSFPFDKRVYREATSLKENGYNVFVICPRSNHDKEKELVHEGIYVRRYKDYLAKGGVLSYLLEYASSVFKIFFLFLSTAIKNKINVVHVANPPDFFWPVALTCKVLGIKFIYDQHDLAPEMSMVKFHSRALKKMLMLNEKLTVKFADAVIVVNNNFKERLIAEWGTDKNKITVVYNGPHESFHVIQNDGISKKYKNKRVILYIGLMTVNDNIEVIINAANELINNQGKKDLHFVLIGDGDVRKKMEELAASFNITDNVEFTGIVNHDMVRKYLNVAEVCIAPDLPNGLNEYLTLVKVLEYMKTSKAFVSFKLKETMDFADGAGLYAEDEKDFANKIIYLLENPDVAAEMGALGSKIINDNYLWSHSEEKLLNLYKSLT
jgi:glycosyltransferase involved in cell wall biosynthesis